MFGNFCFGQAFATESLFAKSGFSGVGTALICAMRCSTVQCRVEQCTGDFTYLVKGAKNDLKVHNYRGKWWKGRWTKHDNLPQFTLEMKPLPIWQIWSLWWPEATTGYYISWTIELRNIIYYSVTDHSISYHTTPFNTIPYHTHIHKYIYGSNQPGWILFQKVVIFFSILSNYFDHFSNESI